MGSLVNHIVRRFCARFVVPIVVMCSLPGTVMSQSWNDFASLPTPRVNASAAATLGGIYVVGGFGADRQPLKIVERFDFFTREWSEEIDEMNVPRANMAIARVGSAIVVSGGITSNGKPTKKVEFYNPIANVWDDLDDLNVARSGHAMVVFQGALYVLGGAGEDGKILGSIEVLVAGEWQMVEEFDLPIPVAGVKALATNSEIVLIGGVGQLGPTEVIQVVDFSDSAVVLPPLPEPRSGFDAVVIGGRFFVIGGRTSSNELLTSIVRFNPDTADWVETANLRRARVGFSALTVENLLLIVGGRDRNGTVVRLIEAAPLEQVVTTEETLFEPVTSEIAAFPNPATDRVGIELSNADVYSVELYDTLGRIIREAKIEQSGNNVEIRRTTTSGVRLNPGIYFVRVRHQNALQTISFVFM